MTKLRLTLVVVACAVLSAFGAAPATASTSIPVDGMFTVHFPKAGQQHNVYPCPPDTFCGVGTLRGLGTAEIDVVDENFQPIDGTSCLSFDTEVVVRLLSDGSALTLSGSGRLCFPGASGDVPPNEVNQDYGHPTFWTAELTTEGASSTGLFAGASGTVAESFSVAGGVGTWRLAGDIETT
jgi:hypothetical protein